MARTNVVIPKEWQSATLSSIAELEMGQSPSSDSYNQDGVGVPFFQGKADFSKTGGVVVRQWTSAPIKMSESGDILLSVRAPVGDIALNDRKACIGRGLAALRAKPGVVNQAFLFQIIKSMKESLNAMAQGSTFTAINGPALRNMPAVLPPIVEQKKIAEILGAVDEEIQKTDEIIAATEKLKSGLMQQLFTRGIGHTKFKETDIGEIPATWQVVSLHESSDKIVVGFVGVCEPYYTDSSGIPMLRTGNLKDWGIDFNEMKCVTSDFHKKNVKSQLKPGDILIARHGYSGLACIVPNELIEANCLNVVIIRANQSMVNPQFLYYAINSPLSSRQMHSKVGGSTQKVVNTSDIKLVKIGIPGKTEQNKIVEILSLVDEKISINKKLKAKLILLKKGLMQDLLSGKVRTL